MGDAEAERRVVISYRPGEVEGEASASGASRDWDAVPLMLPHPKTGVPTQYMLIQGRLQEVNWFKERFRSWFVGDAVIDHGSLYLSTPVDPLFIALSILEASRQQGGTSEGVFQDGVQILQADASPAHAQLAQLVAGSFALLCDVKEAGGDAYYRLSDDKVLAWLRCKLKRLRGSLLRAGAAYAALDDASLTHYAVGVLGEYLSEAWFTRLCAACGVAPEAEVAEDLRKRLAVPEMEEGGQAAKRIKANQKDVAKRRAAEAKAEAKAAQLRRETRGMKSISSLFGKYQCNDRA